MPKFYKDNTTTNYTSYDKFHLMVQNTAWELIFTHFLFLLTLKFLVFQHNNAGFYFGKYTGKDSNSTELYSRHFF